MGQSAGPNWGGVPDAGGTGAAGRALAARQSLDVPHGHALDHPLLLRPELTQQSPGGVFPILAELTPVRMDLSHSGWSDFRHGLLVSARHTGSVLWVEGVRLPTYGLAGGWAV